jgi:hypothetical protein
MRGQQWSIPVYFFLIGALGATERWHQLLDKNPFIGPETPKPATPEPPPAYEFRGRSVEGGQEYFSLYDLNAKRAYWVSRAGGGELNVKDYGPAGLVLIDQAGKTIRLALKQAQPSRAGTPRLQALASTAILANPAPPAAAPSASETQRLEQVAGEIRARRAQRQQATRG